MALHAKANISFAQLIEDTTVKGSTERKALEAFVRGFNVNHPSCREFPRALRAYFGALSPPGRAISIYTGK